MSSANQQVPASTAAAAGGRKSRGTKRKAEGEAESAPARKRKPPSSAYSAYLARRQTELKDMKFGDRNKQIGSEWKSMDVTARAPYEAEFQEAKRVALAQNPDAAKPKKYNTPKPFTVYRSSRINEMQKSGELKVKEKPAHASVPKEISEQINKEWLAMSSELRKPYQQEAKSRHQLAKAKELQAAARQAMAAPAPVATPAPNHAILVSA